jgi:hypothetical protein
MKREQAAFFFAWKRTGGEGRFALAAGFHPCAS